MDVEIIMVSCQLTTGGIVMARARAYRHDVRCPHCGSNWMAKYGKSNGKQTYMCQECYHRYTPAGKQHKYPEAVKRQAIQMYCEGNGVSAISRVLNVKTGTVYSWIQKRGANPSMPWTSDDSSDATLR